MHRRLSDDERETRQSAGISLVRLWPFALMVLCDFIVSMNDSLFGRCLGNRLAVPAHGIWGARTIGAVRAVLAIPCSIYSPGGDAIYWSAIVLLVLSIPFAARNFLWIRRHEAYWDIVRKREAGRRAEKRAEKARQRAT